MSCFPTDQLERMFVVAGLLGSIITMGFCIVMAYIGIYRKDKNEQKCCDRKD